MSKNLIFSLRNGTARGTKTLELRSGSSFLLAQRTIYPEDNVENAKIDMLRAEIAGKRLAELLPTLDELDITHPHLSVAEAVLMAKKRLLGLVCS